MLVVMERPVGKVWQVPRDSGQAVWYGISLVVSVWYGGMVPVSSLAPQKNETFDFVG